MSGKLTLISSATASDSASVVFTSGIDSTYDEYVFYFVDIHAETLTADFEFQCSTNGGSSYGVTLTSSIFMAYHQENDGGAALTYQTGFDEAQSTNFQLLMYYLDNAADTASAGELHLFNPSSTSKVKHFYSTTSVHVAGPREDNNYIAGYFNTTSAINAIKFRPSSGNFYGNIYMFGVR